MAKVNKYNWHLKEALPKIDDHSLVKLDIIERYLEIYLRVLTKNHLMDSLKLSVIDGFAGGGLYHGNILGSPLRICKTIEETQKCINIEREMANSKLIKFDIDIHLIEKNPDTFSFLKNTIHSHGCSEKVFLQQGEFENYLDSLIKKIQEKSRSQKSIFVLDQYGFADASLPAIRKIFNNLKKVEVILTFSVDSLIDYLTRDNTTILENMGMNKEDMEQIFDIKEDNDFSRAKIQPLLYEKIVKVTGAPFYTPFFIKSDTSNRSYWLFHLSTHATARDEMVNLHWEQQNSFHHYGKPGLKMLLGYDSQYKNSFDIFKFDSYAKNKSIETLSNELPRLIYDHKAIEFSALKNTIVNETPATIEMIKESLEEAIQDKEIIVRSPNGTIRQKSNTIQSDDVLLKPNRVQKRMKL